MVRLNLGEDVEQAENVPVVESELPASGIVCEGCAQKITQELRGLEGVQKVLPGVRQKRVQVLHDPQKISEERLRGRLKRLGYL